MSNAWQACETALAQDHTGLVFFRPRPDSPDGSDQQTAFYTSKNEMAFLLHGNASGASECACAR